MLVDIQRGEVSSYIMVPPVYNTPLAAMRRITVNVTLLIDLSKVITTSAAYVTDVRSK